MFRTSPWLRSARWALLAGLGTCALLAPSSEAAPPEAPVAGWVRDMAAAAAAWLDAGGRAVGGQLGFDDPERGNWHYVPRPRRGIPLGTMPPAQRERALVLLRSALSAPGATQAEAVMALEGVLRDLEGSSPRFRDPGAYHLLVFGAPSTPPWAWRLEGHHLSLNVTVATPARVSMTPWFLGTDPARIPRGPRAGERLQPLEQDLALELARSLDDTQWRAALLDVRAPADVITGPGRAASLARPEGLAHGALRPPQQALLGRLLEVYVGRAHDAFGRPFLELVRQGLADTRFAWAGSREPGQAFYYRVHGPRLLIELDNTQNRANHVHSLWRDPTDDFGRDALRAHYADAAHDLLPGR